MTLDVHPGSQTQDNVGTLLAVAGGVVALIGFIRLTTTGSSPSSDRTGLELLGVGAAVGIAGLVLFRMSRTTVTSSTGSTFSEQRERDARRAAPVDRAHAAGSGVLRASSRAERGEKILGSRASQNGDRSS